MKIEQCDMCGAQSPNSKGLFIANHWTKVEVKPYHGGEGEKFAFCQECLPAEVVLNISIPDRVYAKPKSVVMAIRKFLGLSYLP
jgi:hypothetical protein